LPVKAEKPRKMPASEIGAGFGFLIVSGSLRLITTPPTIPIAAAMAKLACQPTKRCT